MAERGLIAADYDWDGEEYALPKHVEIAVFRIVQEALNNVVHHSGVKMAKVRVHFTPTAINILVEDKGRGFDPDAVSGKRNAVEPEEDEEETQEHFGILSMKERAKLVGAELQILSSPGRGAKVHLRIPNRMANSGKTAPKGE